jgi:hypothetical protein
MILWKKGRAHALPLSLALVQSTSNSTRRPTRKESQNQSLDHCATHAPMASRYLAKIRSGGMFGLVGSLHRSWHSIPWSGNLFVFAPRQSMKVEW